jgi:hypothetical protein
MMIGFCLLVLVGGFTVCDRMINDESEDGDQHLLGRIVLVSHDYDDGYDDGGGGGYDYDDGGQGNGNDQRKCYRGENCRGSFSPGPFDRSPIDFSDSCISLDCSGREKKDDKKAPREP